MFPIGMLLLSDSMVNLMEKDLDIMQNGIFPNLSITHRVT